MSAASGVCPRCGSFVGTWHTPGACQAAYDRAYTREALRSGANVLLLTTDEHRDLYRTSAAFHAAVNTLAGMLPAMIDGLAAQARETEARRADLIAALERSPGPGLRV